MRASILSPRICTRERHPRQARADRSPANAALLLSAFGGAEVRHKAWPIRAAGVRPALQPPSCSHVLGSALKETDVFWVFGFEDVRPAAHVGPHQFVSRTVERAELKLALAKSKMQECIADGVGAVHRIAEIVSPGNEVAAEEVCIADGGKNPRGGLPFGLGLR